MAHDAFGLCTLRELHDARLPEVDHVALNANALLPIRSPMRYFLILSLLLVQNVCLAQSIDPSSLMPPDSDKTLTLGKPFSHSNEVNRSTARYEIQAGTYRAEFSGENGTFYRGSKDCLTVTTVSAYTGSPGGGVVGATKYDCGVLVLKNGGALIYFYENGKRLPSIRSAACGNDCAAKRKALALARQQIGKIFFAPGMAPSVELAASMAPAE